MTYEPQTWENTPSGGTPTSAERFNHMEQGIAAAHGGAIKIDPSLAIQNVIQPITDVPALTLKEHQAGDSAPTLLIKNADDSRLVEFHRSGVAIYSVVGGGTFPLILKDNNGVERVRWHVNGGDTAAPTVSFIGGYHTSAANPTHMGGWLQGIDISAPTGGHRDMVTIARISADGVSVSDDFYSRWRDGILPVTHAFGFTPAPTTHRLHILAGGSAEPELGTLCLAAQTEQTGHLLDFTGNDTSGYQYAYFDVGGRLTLKPDNVAVEAFRIRYFDDAQNRFHVDAYGAVGFGSGAVAPDTFFERTAPGVLRVKNKLSYYTVSGDVGWVGNPDTPRIYTTDPVWVNNAGSSAFQVGTAMGIDTNSLRVSFFGPFSGSGNMQVFIANTNSAPSSNPTGGGLLYVDAGKLMYRGPSGNVTTVAPA
jgi:hypothetical protein